MKRYFGIPRKEELDPKVRWFFPWALFLVCAILFATAAHYIQKPTIDDYACYGRAQYQAMWDNRKPCPRAGMLDKTRDFFGVPRIWHEEGDPYACFGGGRYDAMRDGRVCPGFEGQ